MKKATDITEKQYEGLNKFLNLVKKEMNQKQLTKENQ